MHARDLRLLLYFAEIVRFGSIRGAARALSVSPPVVSTALRDLEALVGTTLIRRTTRHLALTETGHRIHDEASRMCKHAGAAMSVTAGDRPVAGTLRLSVPVELANSWLPEVLAEYRAAWPDVRLHVVAEDRPLDLVASDVDLALRATFSRDADAAGRLDPPPRAILPLELVCAPQIMADRGSLAQRLQRTGFIGARDRPDAPITGHAASGMEQSAKARVTLVAADRLTIRALALRGFGAALLIRHTVVEDLDAGRLVRLAPDLEFGVVGVQVLAADPLPAPPVLAFQRMMAAR